MNSKNWRRKKVQSRLNSRTTQCRKWKDEEYEDSLISGLIDEGLKTEVVPDEKVRKEFRKHGVDF